MGLRNRLLRTCAHVWISVHGRKQEALAAELRDELRLSKGANLGPIVSRYLSGEVANSSLFDAMPIVFWRDIVAGDYPLPWLIWLERAYASYDSNDAENPLGRSSQMSVRRLLAEGRELFRKEGGSAEEARYPRFEAARRLMRGIAVAVEQRALRTDTKRMKEGIAELKEAARLFGTLKPEERALSVSDDFHMALALNMADWLLSELPESESLRKHTLQELKAFGAVRAYEALAAETKSWMQLYNISEIYGELGDDAAAKKALIQAIELNPRLADFDLLTVFDGLDEPLSKAPALQIVIPAIRKERRSWLDERIEAYRKHAESYEQDVSKGIKAMLRELKNVKAPLAIIILANVALVTSSFLLDAVALAKPIFGA